MQWHILSTNYLSEATLTGIGREIYRSTLHEIYVIYCHFLIVKCIHCILVK
jgi:hypothetical protein